MFMRKLISQNSLDNLKIFIFTSYIFLWSFNIFGFDIKLLIFLIVPCLFFEKKIKIPKLYKNKIIYFCFYLIFIFFITLFYLVFFDGSLYDFILFFTVFLIIIIISFYYHFFFLENINNIITLFIAILFLHFCYENLNGNYYSFSNDLQCTNNWFSSNGLLIQLFKENSHIGVLIPPIIIFIILSDNIHFSIKTLIIIFLLLFPSVTMLVGLFFLCLFFILFLFKKINFNKKILFVFTILISFLIINDKTNCSRKTYETLSGIIISFANKIFDKNLVENNKSKLFSKLKKIENKEKFEGINISSRVYINSLNIALDSILNYPLGVGLNNYKHVFEKFIKTKKFEDQYQLFLENKKIEEDQATFNLLKNLNKNDASNNFAKIITELGCMSIIIFYILIKFIKSNNCNLRTKYFLLSMIIMQFIRGAGYFNAGFLFIFITIFLLVYRKNEN